MNAQVIVAAIAHEVRQPLTRITTGGNAAQRFLKMVPPEHDKAHAALDGIVSAGHRASEAIDGFRAVFAKSDQTQQLVDVNEIIREALESMSTELEDHHIEPRDELMSELPHVYGNRSHRLVSHRAQGILPTAPGFIPHAMERTGRAQLLCGLCGGYDRRAGIDRARVHTG